jgi:stage V sporulation protein SpoVS
MERGAGGAPAIDAPAPPAPITTLPATDASAFSRSRDALVAAVSRARGSLLWTDVEDAVYPQGWAAQPGTLFRPGLISLAGDERASTDPLRRNAALLRNWSRLLPRMRAASAPRLAVGKPPEGVRLAQFSTPAGSAVSIVNEGRRQFEGDLRVKPRPGGRTVPVPGVRVAPGESLWLPVGVSIGPNSLCRECTNFSGAEHLVYATAELLSIEFENGILAMEFAAPRAGEAVLQLARRPVGPYLAGGRPQEFDWDEKTLRARLAIPASDAPGRRMRVGIAVEEPDASAFFEDPRRLLIGRTNRVATVYSSADVAARSRLRLPEGFTAAPAAKSPNEIDYEIGVPADALHGDWADLAIEADGLPLGRTRAQLLRPVSIRLAQPVQFHVAPQAELISDPPTAPVELRAGGNLEIIIRNNSQAIQTYFVEPSGEGLEFLPVKTEISIGPKEERSVSMRVFPAELKPGVRDWRVRVTGAATVELPFRAVFVPRTGAVVWSADLDGDGADEWILESRHVRAVFSALDGGHWMDFTWKEADLDFLPAQGAFAAAGPVEVRAAGDALEFTGKGWKRTARLVDAALTIEQTTALPPDPLTDGKRGNVSLTVRRESPSRVVYSLK